MHRKRISLPSFLLVSHLCALLCVSSAEAGDGTEYPNPSRYAKEIEAFERAAKENAPPKDAIVFFGSSSIRGWREHIVEDLAPLTIVRRGFGGSNMYDALHYADRIVIPYRPRAIVLYEGDNDTALGIAPERIRDTFLALVKKFRTSLPDTRIYFISIKPSIARWEMWGRMVEANHLIATECERDKQLTYIDIGPPTLGDDGRPRQDIFAPDNLHYNRKGYLIWRDTIRPILMREEAKGEAGEEGR
jgi:lysophospholipase L1-like esterase